MTPWLSGIVQTIIGIVEGGRSGEPHNDAILILAVFFASAAFWHLLLWRRMLGHRRFWRAIDYAWYFGAFLSVVLGTYQAERAAEAARLRALGQVIQIELLRQDPVLLSLLDACGGAPDAGSAAADGLFDAAMCAAAIPVLNDARLFVFEHVRGVDTLPFIESKMARMTALCGKLAEAVARREAASEVGTALLEARLYATVHCDDAPVMAGRVAAYRAGSIAQAGTGPFGGMAHLWPLLLCLVVGLRITKTTAEVRQAGRAG